ncbi:MAG: response regulator [Candidatus Xenobia bacterium]
MGDAQPMKILVADDDAEMRELIRHALSGENYQLIVARDGSEAIRLAQTEHPHLIILDVEMPTLDGFKACRMLRSDPQTGSVPIIMLTSRSGEQDIVRGFERGANDYITKPFSIGTLRAKIKTWLLRSGVG